MIFEGDKKRGEALEIFVSPNRGNRPGISFKNSQGFLLYLLG